LAAGRIVATCPVAYLVSASFAVGFTIRNTFGYTDCKIDRPLPLQAIDQTKEVIVPFLPLAIATITHTLAVIFAAVLGLRVQVRIDYQLPYADMAIGLELIEHVRLSFQLCRIK